MTQLANTWQGHDGRLWPLEVSSASFGVSYNRKKVEALILTLIDQGHYYLADALRACKKESARPGALRIMRVLPEVKH